MDNFVGPTASATLDAGSGDLLWHNELKGLGHNDVTIAIAGKAVQFVSTHSHSSS